MKYPWKSMFIAVAFLSLGARAGFGQTDAQKQRVREFVVMGYQGINVELNSKKGPYLTTLMELLGAPSGAETKTRDALMALLKSNPNIMDFADRVAELPAGAPSEF